MVQFVQSNVKGLEYSDLEKIRDIIRDELFNRDMEGIKENCSKNMKRLTKYINEEMEKIIKKEVEKQLKSRVKK